MLLIILKLNRHCLDTSVRRTLDYNIVAVKEVKGRGRRQMLYESTPLQAIEFC